ncbi:MAG: Spy/CpxP family protein refolding chaperone [Ignavibacteriaceae bacterium]|nr:Spy/CpxP family protein refolding chaperone [Ignavibacteriaceae bacterium]
MRIKMFTLIAIISALLVSQDLFAQETMIRKRDRDQLQIHQKLNLTEEQQEKADILKLAHQKEMVDLKANLEKKEIEMAELKNKGNYTREEFLSKTNEIISARNQIALSMANHQMDVYQILDETQKKDWNKMSGEFGERRQKRIMKMMRDVDVRVE